MTMASMTFRMRRTPRVSAGFTLIELMITVAIVALLAAIAIPSYQDSVWKGKRAEAKAAILKALQAEERYYTQNNTYVAYPYTAPPSGAFPGYSADSPTNSRYTIAAAGCGAGIASCVNVIATVYPSGADPKCGTTLSMDSVGNKLPATTGATALCWK
jgi:type IV pilus assembly protein PilE